MSLIRTIESVDGVEQVVYNETLDVFRVDLTDGAPSDVLSEVEDVRPSGYSSLTPMVDREGGGAILYERVKKAGGPDGTQEQVRTLLEHSTQFTDDELAEAIYGAFGESNGDCSDTEDTSRGGE